MSETQHRDLVQAAQLILEEAVRAASLHPPFNSAHEGKAVIEEEFDELWTEIKAKEKDHVAILNEAVQLGAMAVRFVADVGLRPQVAK